MNELTVPAVIELPITDTLASIPALRAAADPDAPMYALRTDTGWTDVSATQFDALVQSVARGLVARGIEAGQPVAVLSPTRYEWTVLDFALWAAGAFAVPIYDSSSAEQIEWILADSAAVAVIIDSQASAQRVRGAVPDRPADLGDGRRAGRGAGRRGGRHRRRGPQRPHGSDEARPIRPPSSTPRARPDDPRAA